MKKKFNFLLAFLTMLFIALLIFIGLNSDYNFVDLIHRHIKSNLH